MEIKVHKIESECPSCSQSVIVPSPHVNQPLVCPHCEEGFQLVGQTTSQGEIVWFPLPLPILEISKITCEALYLGSEYVIKLSYFDDDEGKMIIPKELLLDSDRPLLSRSLDLSKKTLASRGSKAKVDAQCQWNHLFMITHIREAAEVRFRYYLPKGKSFRKKSFTWQSSSDDEARALLKKITDRFPHGHHCVERKASFWESYAGSFHLCAFVFGFAFFYWLVGSFDPQFDYKEADPNDSRRAARLRFLYNLYQIFVVAPAQYVPRWFWSLFVFGIPLLAIFLAANRIDSRMKATDYLPNSPE